MKRIFVIVLSIIMLLSLAACGSTTATNSTSSNKEKSGEDYTTLVFNAFWEGTCDTFGVNYSDYKWTHTATSYITDSTTSDGYTAHYYLIKTAFDTKNAFGQKINHEVTARCYYVPDYSELVYVTYITLDGEKILFDEEKENWLLGIGGSSAVSSKTDASSSNKESNSNTTTNNDNKKPNSNNSNSQNNTATNSQTSTPKPQTPSTNPNTEHVHKWNNGAVTKEASCSQDGIKTYTCATFGETKEENISKKSHSFTQKVESTKYLKSRKTYTNGSVYYFSCSCGEKGSDTFTLNDRIEWITTDMLQKDFNLSSGWVGANTNGELRIWTHITGIGEQGDSYLIYNQMKNGMGDSVYNGSYNGVPVRFYRQGNQYVFNYDDLVAAGII